MPRPFWKIAWYNFLHVGCRLASVVLFRIRVRGRRNVPDEGALLVCSNHQSHFDPVLVGLALDRRLNFLARDTLFAFTPFRWLIQSLDAIPIDREGMGLAGIKETLRRLKKGEGVLIFPGRHADRRRNDRRTKTGIHRARPARQSHAAADGHRRRLRCLAAKAVAALYGHDPHRYWEVTFTGRYRTAE